MTEINALTLFTIENLAAIGALFVSRHIPRGEITGRIFFAAIEYGLIFTVLHNDLRATLGARNADITSFLLSKATSRKA